MSTIQAYTPKSHKKQQLWQVAKLPASHGPRLIDAVITGLPVETVELVATEINVTQQQLLLDTGIKQRNFARRRTSGRLSTEESERMTRFVRIVDLATDMMEGNGEDAMHWLTQPAKALGGRRPVDLLETEIGALEVIHLIGRIQHGVFS